MLNNNFFDKVRKSLFNNRLTQKQVENLNKIYEGWKKVDGKSIDLLAFGLATAYHEVGIQLNPIEENLNYTAKRITEVWPSRFTTTAEAKPYANNPAGLANKVYGGRLGNNTSGDGYKYRGRGYPQITGKANYEKFEKLLKLNLISNPELALQPEVAAQILFLGIRDGLFTGRKLSEYTDFSAARATVNADVGANGPKIRDYTLKFKDALVNGISSGATKPVTPTKPVVVTPNTPEPTVKETYENITKPRTLIDIIVDIFKKIFRRG